MSNTTKQASICGEPTEKVQGRRPDRSAHVSALESNAVYNIYLCEIKPEGECKDRPDLSKLGVMMKDCLDNALMHGAAKETFSIMGLLIEGRMCTVYVLDLPGNGLYRMIELDIFFLPESIKDLNVLSFAYQPLLNIRAHLIKITQLLLDNPPDLPLQERYTVEHHLRSSCRSPNCYTEFYV